MEMDFARPDWKLFRNMETLCQKAGVKKESIPKLAIKELVDNALDASGGVKVGLIGDKGFYVEDNGNGFDSDILADLFSINRPMITSKLLRLPTRGALGNGLRVVTGAIVSSGGKLFVNTRGERYEVIPQDDGTAVVNYMGECDPDITRIEGYFGGNIYLKESDLFWGKLASSFNKGINYDCETSAYWYTSESFFELCNAYTGSIKDLCLFFEGINNTKANNIIRDMSIVGATVNTPARILTFDGTELLLSLLREGSKPVSHKKLGECGSLHQYGEYVKKTGTLKVKTTKGQHNAEIPYIVEGWTLFQEKISAFILVNKTPITMEVNANNSNTKGSIYINTGEFWTFIKSKPAQIILNIITPYMPITSDGKAPDLSKFSDEMKDVIQKANRKAKKAYTEKTYGATSEKEVIYDCLPSAIRKTSSNGTHKFSQRQLYYSVRPYIIDAFNKEPEYNYFCRVLTEYENEYGNIKNLYRDPRGILYHPHTGETIPLGTVAVEEYVRPAWTFNKIIYLEKKGALYDLQRANFPEKYDCALMSSEGFASRAVKDLVDFLGETDEEITVYCVHDGDAAGTMIYETLQEGTLSREARKIKVINLGLEPWEAVEMDLQTEKVNNKGGRRPVAGYVRKHYWETNDKKDWGEWLQSNRVELNAMTPEEFVVWMEKKMEEHGVSKVIPNIHVLRDKLEEDVEAVLRAKLQRKILEESGYEDLVQAELTEKLQDVKDKLYDLTGEVTEALEETPVDHWTAPIKNIAKEIVEGG
jgi:hypothetical protein